MKMKMTNVLRYGGMLRCDQQTGLCYEDPNRSDPDECSTIGEKCVTDICTNPKYKCGVMATDYCISDNCDGTGIFDTKQDCINSGCGRGTGPNGISNEYIMLVGAIVGLLVLSIVKGKK